MSEIEFHECADIFPLLEDEQLEDLAQDIEKNGQLEPIVLYKGQILDGRNRFLACRLKNIEPNFRVLNLNIDPIDFVVSKNLKRRQLSSAEKAESALKALKLKEKLREVQINTMEFDSKLEKEAIKEAIKHEDKLDMAKKYGTTTVKIDQVDTIKKAIEKDPKIKESFDGAKKGKKPLNDVHDEALGKPPKKRKSTNYKEQVEELKMSLSFFRVIEKAAKELKLWEKIIEHINPKFEEYKSPYTIEDYRKAELI